MVWIVSFKEPAAVTRGSSFTFAGAFAGVCRKGLVPEKDETGEKEARLLPE